MPTVDVVVELTLLLADTWMGRMLDVAHGWRLMAPNLLDATSEPLDGVTAVESV